MSAVRLLFVSLTAFACLAAQQEPTYALLWKPKSDDVLDYSLSLHIDVEQYKFQYNTDIHMKVLKVKDNGDYDLETSTKNTKIKFGEDDEMATDDEPAPTVESFNAKGEKIEQGTATDDEDTPNPVGKILSEVTEFAAPASPVRKGDSWSKNVQADAKSKTAAARLDYEVVGTEVEGDEVVIRVDYRYRQTEGADPVTAAGTYRLRRSDFSVSSFEATVANFKMDADAPAGQAKLEMKRT